MIGQLARCGIVLQRSRIRASIHRVDPVNTALRRSVTVRRRVYHVAGTNCLWHIDGNHKLIKWRFVIHGGIDGFSRTIVYLHCSNNNRAVTHLSLFVNALQSYGLPEKVRSDLGGENVDVWRYMVEQHSSTSSVITGSSTHNERIERLWRDVFRCVGVLFYETVRHLEDEGKLNTLNEVDMYCLHYVFLARINEALNSFVESWNNHPISTERNFTPNQLFIEGALHQSTSPPPPPQTSVNILTASNNAVEVPRSSFTPCATLKIYMDQIDVTRNSDNFGIDIYNEVVDVVGQHLVTGCSRCTVQS